MATIFKRGNKLYLEFFDIQKNKKRQKSTGLEDTKSNRLHLENIIIPQLEYRQKQEPKPIIKRFEYYINFYLKTKENLVTYPEIHAKTNLILEHFGNVPIDNVTPLQCKEYIFSLDVSTKTKRNYLNVLSGIFDVACEDLVIKNNPTKFIKLIKSQKELEKDDIEPFSKSDIQNLFNNSSGILKDFLGISFYTGARPVELLALKIQDIDFVNNTISIYKQYTARKLKEVLKTKGSKRIIPLFSPAIPYFKSLIENAKSNMSSYLFARDKNSTLYSIDNIRGKKGMGVIQSF
jgi:integrase